MLNNTEHHMLRMDDLRREAARERMAREALAARKESGHGDRRFHLPLSWRRVGRRQREDWVRAV
ncbi:hypothetical protein [Streptomyces iconiensis]|uniref:Uncharacterized protein n=1 Tax=Streptomyces iconiensis TaxID=1384038 RepID=A0ABT6ZTT8_9ACTN|nr:hypothetical protein [Streptomyces iconiensis]MDJ1132473.1 hypothetical protein [Streptomyces iconiensis]